MCKVVFKVISINIAKVLFNSISNWAAKHFFYKYCLILLNCILMSIWKHLNHSILNNEMKVTRNIIIFQSMKVEIAYKVIFWTQIWNILDKSKRKDTNYLLEHSHHWNYWSILNFLIKVINDSILSLIWYHIPLYDFFKDEFDSIFA